MRLLLIWASCWSVLAPPASAFAQDDEAVEEGRLDGGGLEDLEPEVAADEGYHDVVRLDVHAILGYYSNAGLGVRIDLPIVPSGLLDGVDDDLSLSLGADLFWFFGADGGFGVFPLMAFQWNFYVGDSWSLFPEVGAALLFAPSRDEFWKGFIAPFFAFGVRYHLNPRNAFLFRINWPSGLQIGFTF